MNEKFTPANWQLDEYGDIVQAETDRIICYFIPSRNDVDTANKRLVINAPNLYHKLFEAVSYLENGFTSNTERRLFVSGIKELLREVTPDFEEGPEYDDTCDLIYDEDMHYWECSECEGTMCFEDGSPKDNNYQYCPHCGRKIAREIRDYED